MYKLQANTLKQIVSYIKSMPGKPGLSGRTGSSERTWDDIRYDSKYRPFLTAFGGTNSVIGLTASQNAERVGIDSGYSLASAAGPQSMSPQLEGMKVHSEFNILAAQLKTNYVKIYTNKAISSIIDDSDLKLRPDLVVRENNTGNMEVYELKPISYYYNPSFQARAEKQIDNYAAKLGAERGTTYQGFFQEKLLFVTHTNVTREAYEVTRNKYQLSTYPDKSGMVYYQKVDEQTNIYYKSPIQQFIEAPLYIIPIIPVMPVPVMI